MKYFSVLAAVCILFSSSVVAHASKSQVYFSPNGGCMEAIVGEINKAHKTIDIAMFSLTARDIAQSLLAAKDRKVVIRIILDKDQLKDRYSKSRYLIAKGVNVKFHLGQGLMHNKFAVIDNQLVITGSFNWTVTADKKNSENLLILHDKDLAHQYSKQFKHLWLQSGESQIKENKPGE